MFYPLERERTEDVHWALKHFKGIGWVDLIYTDYAKQYKKSARMLGIPYDHAWQGHPRSNAVAERHGGTNQDAIRACCVTGGLPGCFWPFIGTCVCVLSNARRHSDGPRTFNGSDRSSRGDCSLRVRLCGSALR